MAMVVMVVSTLAGVDSTMVVAVIILVVDGLVMPCAAVRGKGLVVADKVSMAAVVTKVHLLLVVI
jgi:hypothetical protein